MRAYGSTLDFILVHPISASVGSGLASGVEVSPRLNMLSSSFRRLFSCNEEDRPRTCAETSRFLDADTTTLSNHAFTSRRCCLVCQLTNIHTIPAHTFSSFPSLSLNVDSHVPNRTSLQCLYRGSAVALPNLSLSIHTLHAVPLVAYLCMSWKGRWLLTRTAVASGSFYHASFLCRAVVTTIWEVQSGRRTCAPLAQLHLWYPQRFKHFPQNKRPRCGDTSLT
ncbi:hypothetical protein EDC04DRAFT_1248638 [Pisolithus marmoratus]|nr:hypothetical protein EDC04DRAFT_1248638 [Pisolithus marmoratus]